ncbi:hypothetical protein [Massilia luteola]|uniref:hypothetical protein n=1 Tax=Massilia luteola TaxID=3081751 RepID=UPI002ACBDACC|nr:hypothetical protein [Massilia sp. Gc5]
MTTSDTLAPADAVGRALAVTAPASDPDDKRDQSEVLMSIEGPVAYNSDAGVHYIVAGHLEY